MSYHSFKSDSVNFKVKLNTNIIMASFDYFVKHCPTLIRAIINGLQAHLKLESVLYERKNRWR
ncbi:hypothetical protein EWZ79_02405 [Helicobacter pylori]|nr:hypothetical protein [Helicobacter pylori]OOP93070.1 hypothetical protein B0X37_01845 [Helicobacter pylori]QEF36428.1 hypothetical protein D2C77_03300 [Helicobacter pylori]RKV28278.1 hypothetical protein DD743_00475 [Helicobacter pylori]